MIDFEYAAFWRHCRDHLGEPTDDLQVHVFDADYQAMKYDRSRAQKPFLHRSMEARRIPDTDPIAAAAADSLGAFLVLDRNEEGGVDTAKRVMFFVVPSSYDREGFDTVVTADHFTFLQNYDVPERKRLQLHFTHYLPDRNPERGGAVRDSNHLPLRFRMPDNASEFASSVIVNAEASRYSASLFELFRRPYVAQTQTQTQTGGGKRGLRRRRRGAGAVGGGGFDDLWRDLPIHRIVMLSVGGFVTVCITDRFKRDRAGTMSHAYVLRHPPHGDIHIACAQVARRMEGMTWESFRDAGPNELLFD